METLAATNNLFPTLSFAEEVNPLYQGTAKKSIPVEEFATAYKMQEDKFIANKKETDKISTMLANFNALKDNEPHLLEATNKTIAQLEDLKKRGNYEDAEIEISGIVRDYSSDQMLQGVLGNVAKNEEYIKSLEAAKIPDNEKRKLIADAQRNIKNDYVDDVTKKYVSHYNPYKVPETPFDSTAVVEKVIKDFAFDQSMGSYISYEQGPPDPTTGEATYVIHGTTTTKTILASEVAEAIKIALDTNGGYQEHLNYRAHVDTMDVDFSKDDVLTNFITKEDPKGEAGYQKMFDLYKNANPSATEQEINNAMAKEYHKANITASLINFGATKAAYVQQSLTHNVSQNANAGLRVKQALEGATNAASETVYNFVTDETTAPPTLDRADKNLQIVEQKTIKTATAVTEHINNLNSSLKAGEPPYKIGNVTYDVDGYPVLNITRDGEQVNIGDDALLYRLQLEARDTHEEKLKYQDYNNEILKKAGITTDFAGVSKLVETDALGAVEQQRMQAFLYYKHKGDDKSAAIVMQAGEGLLRKGLGDFVENAAEAWKGLNGIDKGKAITNNKLAIVAHTSDVHKEKINKAAKDLAEAHVDIKPSKTITNPKARVIAEDFVRTSLAGAGGGSVAVKTLDGKIVTNVPPITEDNKIVVVSENESTMQFVIANDETGDSPIYTVPISRERQAIYYMKNNPGSTKANIMLLNQVEGIKNGNTNSGFVGDPADKIRVTLANKNTDGISGVSGVPRFIVNVNGLGDVPVGNLEGLQKYVSTLYTEPEVK